MPLKITFENFFAEHMPQDAHSFPSADGERLDALLGRLGVSKDFVNLAFVNHEVATFGTRLYDGDTVYLMHSLDG